jgi:peptidoglycan/LPS O-acetylase OafA/YrhL
VIMVHVSLQFAPSVLAVTHIDFLGQALTFFFALSGFLLYLPYVKRLSTHGSMPKTSAYLRHRVLRVFPAYLVIFLIVNFVLRAGFVQNPITVGWGNGDRGTGMITDPVKLLANLTLTQTLFPATLQTGINPSWSLTTEWGFYLVLPIIGLALFAFGKMRTRPLRAAAWPPLVLLIIGVTTNTIVGALQAKYYPHAVLESYWGPNWVAVLSRSFLGLADIFAFGMIAAVIYVAMTNGKWKSVPTLRLQWILAAVMTVGLVASMVLFVLDPRYVATAFAFASAAFILLIIGPIARGEHSAIASITDWRPVRYLGMISLSIYLWHFPVLILVERLRLPIPDNPAGLIMAFVLVSGVTVAFASVSYRFVEKPALAHSG